MNSAFGEPLTRLYGYNRNFVLNHTVKFDCLADYEEDLNQVTELLNDTKALVVYVKHSQ